jgi:predicted transcriptional regulator
MLPFFRQSGVMRPKPNVGRAELEILRYISDHHPLSVREVACHIAGTRGLVRTTVLNVMERLRKKGFLTRKKTDGIYKYSPSVPTDELMRGMVRDFVQRALGDSITPFVAYLVERRDLKDQEIQELKRLVETLDAQRNPKKP